MRAVVTTVLDLAGVALLVVCAHFVWPPAAFGVGGVACLAVSWQQSRPVPLVPPDDEELLR